MIASLIERDHEAGQGVFAVVGNAPEPAWEGRGAGMQELVRLWEAHGAMLEQAVYPRLPDMAGHGGLLEALRGEQGQVVGLAMDLAGRTAQRDADGRWLTDFERLKALFDAQCLREMTALVPLIRDRVPPPEVAEMTRQARALRHARAA